MIPLHDNIPSRTTPWVNYAMIALCTLAFFAQLQSPDGGGVLVERYGMIPARITNPGEPVAVVETVPVETMFGVTLREVRRPAEPAGVPSDVLIAAIWPRVATGSPRYISWSAEIGRRTST